MLDASDISDDMIMGKGVVVLSLELLPILLAPVAAVNSGRIARLCIDKIYAEKSCSKPSKQVDNKSLERFLEQKRVETCYTLMDYVSFLCFAHCMFVWLKATQFGLASLPTFDVSIVPATVTFLLYTVLIQSRLHRGNRSVTALATGYNALLVYIQCEIRALSMADRDALMIIVRVFAGFLFCDHRKAAFAQIFFTIIQAPVPAFRGSGPALNLWWDVILWQIFRQFIIIGPMWLMWFVVEYFVYQFSELIVSKAAVNASLTAARAVLSSQCDAEAILNHDLTFQNPSLKAAHFLGSRLEQMQGRSFLDFLTAADKGRFQQFVDLSEKGLSEQGPVTASSLSMTLELPDGRHREIQVYLSSVPDEFNVEGGTCHLMAMNETQENVAESAQVDELILGDAVSGTAAACCPTPSVEAVEAQRTSHAAPSDHPLQAENANRSPGSAPYEGAGLPGQRLSADTLAFHAWSHSAEPNQPQNLKAVEVFFEPDSLDLKAITLQFSQSRRVKTSLKDCIIPGVWDEFCRWLESVRTGKSAPAPAITPFVCPKLVSSVLAARSTELKRTSSKDGLKAHLMLSLSDIRLRHFARTHRGGAFSRVGRTMGRGTASCVTRSSLSDDV